MWSQEYNYNITYLEIKMYAFGWGKLARVILKYNTIYKIEIQIVNTICQGLAFSFSCGPAFII